MRYHFILVDPARGENVGFAARALNTMGFSSLKLVGSAMQDTKAARKTGYGSHQLLDQIEVFKDLGQALDGIDLSVGTTSKSRIKRYDALSPVQVAAIAEDKKTVANDVALVFGSEENGLSTAQLDQCDLVSTIPMHSEYPSLNLAQSVLIYAWELSKSNQDPSRKPANTELQGLAQKGAIELLSQLGFDSKPLMRQRIMDRIMQLSGADTELLMSVLTKLNRV